MPHARRAISRPLAPDDNRSLKVTRGRPALQVGEGRTPNGTDSQADRAGPAGSHIVLGR